MLWGVLRSPWGRLGILALIVLIIAAAQPSMVTDLYESLRRSLLELFGYGLAPAALWVLAFLAALRWRLRLLFRRWRLFVGAALMTAGAMGGLSFIAGPSGSAMAEHSLGGELGLQVRGNVIVADGLRVAAFGLLGLWIVAPQRLPQTTRFTARWGGHAARALWLATGLLLRVASASLRAGRSVSRRLRRIHLRPQPAPPLSAHVGPLDEAGHFPASADTKPSGSRLPYGRATVASRPSSEAAEWAPPPIALLEQGAELDVQDAENQEMARLIEATLQQHGVEVQVSQIKPGPTVTMFGLVPGWVRRYREVRARDEDGNIVRDSSGRPVTSRAEERTRVKVDNILAREKDLALALAVSSLRIEAPVPGESVVGLEVPNRNPSLVTLRSTVESAAFRTILESGGLPIALGQGTGGEAAALDLLRMPHLLIAGATGSGKTVCMNAAIASILTHWSPLDLRLLLVDPKRVELTPYKGVPHLAAPVIVDTDQVVRVLKGTVHEMFRRYRDMEAVGARNIQAYNSNPQIATPMPYLVLCIDELADLMMSAPYDVEHNLCRLAQLGRATGIHLIVATQRPSVDVVTGLIKANFPSRISFAVASQIDSRTILDSAGAERLLGRGDMLFLAPDAPKPKRVQGAFVSDREITDLVVHWRAQRGSRVPDMPLEELAHEAQQEEFDNTGSSRDELLDRAMELASRYNHLSTSLLQRRLQIGYPRAAKLMDLLEEEGIVGPSSPGGRPREVLQRRNPREPEEEA